MQDDHDNQGSEIYVRRMNRSAEITASISDEDARRLLAAFGADIQTYRRADGVYLHECRFREARPDFPYEIDS